MKLYYELVGGEPAQNSIEVSRTSKGYTWSIKLYFAKDYNKTINRLKRIDGSLKKKFTQEPARLPASTAKRGEPARQAEPKARKPKGKKD